MASLNDGFFPEVWFVSWHNYLDQTNGASISTRSLLLAMRKYGWNVETFCGSSFDNKPINDLSCLDSITGASLLDVRNFQRGVPFSLSKVDDNSIQSMIFLPNKETWKNGKNVGSPNSNEVTDEPHDSFVVPLSSVASEGNTGSTVYGSTSDGNGGSYVSYVHLSISGGTDYCEGEAIYIYYSGLSDKSRISVSAAGAKIDESRNVMSSSNTAGYLVIQTEDDFLDGGDKVLSIQTSFSGEGNPQIAPGCNLPSSVYVHERVEFISFEDESLDVVVYNNDSYRTYIEEDASEGAFVNVRGKGINAKRGAGLRYRLVNPSPYFAIDSVTGKISLKQDAEEIVSQSGTYTHTIDIRAYDSRMCNGQSGGNCWTDEASVSISIKRWTVLRNGGYTALAGCNDGCTVGMLAETCGLTEGEFKDWLTVTNEQLLIELFNGTSVSVKDLSSTDILLSTDRFGVPNVIYMAWFGEIAYGGKAFMNWNTNASNLNSLGFKVEQFDNDVYGISEQEITMARNNFLSGIWNLSYNKRLHGLYMMGHRTTTTIGSDGTNVYTSGPKWDVPYITPQEASSGVSGDCNGQKVIDSSIPVEERQLVSISSSLNYHLGALIIHACNSDNGDAKNLVTSAEKGGIFWGWSGTYNPFVDDKQPIVKNWGYELLEIVPIVDHPSAYIYRLGGKQGTKTFTVSYDDEILDPTDSLSTSLDSESLEEQTSFLIEAYED